MPTSKWTIFVALVVLPLAAFGQSNTVRITGRVEDAIGKVAVKTTVMLMTEDNSKTIAVVQTSEDGIFTFPGVPASDYELRFLAPGFMRLDLPVKATSESTDLGRVTLEGPQMDGPVPTAVAVALSLGHRPDRRVAAIRTLCQVLEHPEQFNGKMIVLRGHVQIAFEDFQLSPADCDGRKLDGVWLEYGIGPKKQPTIWCCGDITPRDPLKVIENQEFRRFDHYLTAKRKAKSCQEARCYLYQVTATLNGRLDSVPLLTCQVGKSQCTGGDAFGHLGLFTTRLVIQSVSDVVAQPTEGKSKR